MLFSGEHARELSHHTVRPGKAAKEKERESVGAQARARATFLEEERDKGGEGIFPKRVRSGNVE